MKNMQFSNLNHCDNTYPIERDIFIIWHELLGHYNTGVMRNMFNEKLVENCRKLQGKEIQCQTLPRIPELLTQS